MRCYYLPTDYNSLWWKHEQLNLKESWLTTFTDMNNWSKFHDDPFKSLWRCGWRPRFCLADFKQYQYGRPAPSLETSSAWVHSNYHPTFHSELQISTSWRHVEKITSSSGIFYWEASNVVVISVWSQNGQWLEQSHTATAAGVKIQMLSTNPRPGNTGCTSGQNCKIGDSNWHFAILFTKRRNQK